MVIIKTKYHFLTILLKVFKRFYLLLGYELRMTDEDAPLDELDALEFSKKIGSYSIDSVAFCAKKNYRPTSLRKEIRIHS